MPNVSDIKRHNGVAGEYAYSATVAYPYEDERTVTFKSSVYGPPIVMVSEANPGGVFVSQGVLDRIGSKLDADWVRRFWAGDAP